MSLAGILSTPVFAFERRGGGVNGTPFDPDATNPPRAYPADSVGFFTVAKLLAVLVPTVSALLLVHTFVMKGITTSIVEERMQQFAVARVEFDIRRTETEKEIAKLEQTDLSVATQMQRVDDRLRSLEADLRTLRERQDEIRARLKMLP